MRTAPGARFCNSCGAGLELAAGDPRRARAPLPFAADPGYMDAGLPHDGAAISAPVGHARLRSNRNSSPGDAAMRRSPERGAAALLCLAVAAGCALSGRRSVPAPAAALPAAPPQGIRVVLLWAAPVDLDLYVTDPGLETVYFANTPSGSGGKLVR